MRKFTQFLLVAVAMIFSTAAMAQSTVTGTIIDSDLNAPLPGANVLEKGTTNGTSTDFDGKFTLKTQASSGEIVISYVGYGSVTVAFNGNTNVGNITLSPDNSLEEVVIVGTGLIDLANDRKTPIAVSTIRASEIQKKIGSQDVTMTLVNTPSVYVAGQAGGFGDSRISVRGFGQDNTAYLLNGQPINGMEDGKMYWSNWSGINDIASVVQIQRGLGSSKLAISSVGGTTNFVTKTTDKREGGFVSLGVANNDYIKTTAAYSTGKNDKGFGASVMFSHWQGDGYNYGTRGEGQTYFISFGYTPNEKHNFNFLITGAPQQHDQNFRKSIQTLLDRGRKFNDNYGFFNGEYKSLRTNFYHKPVINLNWDWTMSDKSNLSTVVYASYGRGGGTGPRGRTLYTNDGLVDWNTLYANNSIIENGAGGYFAAGGGFVTRASMNLHKWYGLVTNFETELTDNLTWNIGADLRTYRGTHFRQVIDFMGLNSWQENIRLKDANNNHANLGTFGTYKNVVVTESGRVNPWYNTFNTIDENQRIAWDYDERINYGGLFTQLEYAQESFSAFFQGAISYQDHIRWDRYQYADDELLADLGGITNPDTGVAVNDQEESEKVDNVGFNVKGGASYTIQDQHKVYANAGYYSRQPYHDNIYLNFTNQVNPLTENEKILGLELGYGFKSKFFSANLNLYRTSWEDRVTTSSRTNAEDGSILFTTNFGVKQLHSGAELDFTAKPLPMLQIKGFVSYGDWQYKDDVITREYDEDLNLLSEASEDVDGGEVGDAAQFTAGLGFNYEIMERFSIDGDYRYYDRLYADVGATKENLELPSFGLMDAGISYKMLLGKNKDNSLDFRFNVNNLFHNIYISESSTDIRVDDLVSDDPADGTYASNGLVYDGLATANQVYFGLGRTWNFSLRYNF
jgi:hypothetical protein